MAADPRMPQLALSVRQPWATLILLGLKSIEIRRWSTTVRERIHLHAGKIADDRDEGWSRIPDKFRHLTDLRGGLIGTVDFVDCIAYRTATHFRRDCQLHLNAPSWFRPPVLFGFRFERPEPCDFRAMAGQVKFFSVPALPVVGSRTSNQPRRIIQPLQTPGRLQKKPVQAPEARSSKVQGSTGQL